MIRIQKPEEAPLPLRERGAALTAEICRRIETGEPPVFDPGAYGGRDVRCALKAAQHDKCCFCESKLSHAQFGDVEHFRPKRATRQRSLEPASRGYYWLAYDWNNLYLSCEVCNRRHKHDLFPLENPEQRVLSHRRAADLEFERPVFIDPGREDPEQLIEFRREYAASVAGHARGAATIDALELNRDALRERRRERHKLHVICLRLIGAVIREGVPDADRGDATDVVDALITAASDRGEYASMTRAMLRRVTPWRLWVPPAAVLLDLLLIDAREGLTMRLDPR